MTRRFAAIVYAWFSAAVFAQAPPQVVQDALKRAGVPLDAVSLVVRTPGGGETLALFNAARPMNPASVIKLVTTAAALEVLGPAYTFRTEFYAEGEIRDGVLAGDLVVKGYGDPRLTNERLWSAIRQLRERGIRDVRGDIVFDRSFFAKIEHDPAAFDNKPRRAYNVGPDALLFNFKTITFHFVPGEKGVAVVAEPAIPSIDIATRLKLVKGACGDWQDRLTADIEERGLLATLQFSGNYAEACAEKSWHISLFDHARYDEALFRSLWSEAGGKIFGKVRDGAVGQSARMVMAIESPALAEIIRDINKHSNNVMARQVFLTIGAETSRQPGDAVRAAEAISAWLKQKGIDARDLVIENGAGLSRAERVSARTLAGVLDVVLMSPLMPELVSSLPLAAVDGTMKKRLADSPVAGQAHIKGGTLNDVRAMAGEVVDRSARRWLVVFMINHANAVAAQPAQDALLQWIYNRP